MMWCDDDCVMMFCEEAMRVFRPFSLVSFETFPFALLSLSSLILCRTRRIVPLSEENIVKAYTALQRCSTIHGSKDRERRHEVCAGINPEFSSRLSLSCFLR